MRCARTAAVRQLAGPGWSHMLAGIDTHKDTLAVAVIDDAGRPTVVTELANTEAGFDALELLLEEHAVTRVGIEGSGCYGRGPTGAGRWAGGGGSAAQPDQPGALRAARTGQDRPG